MYRIVYLSRARVPRSKLGLEDLASHAADLNQKVEVTGLLLYDGDRFIQALEGPKDAVLATMARIAKDHRHDTIQYFDRRQVEERQFGNWSMQFKQAPEGCCSLEFFNKVIDDVDSVEDAELRAMFIGFASLGSKRPKDYICAGT